MRPKTIDPFYLMFSLLGGIVLLFVVAPLAGMFWNVSPADLNGALIDSEVQSSIFLTVFSSMAATLIFAIPAIPLAYLLARFKFPLKRLVTGIIEMPVVIPHSAAGIALLGMLTRDTLLGKTAGFFGLQFVGGALGIMMAMAFVSLPFLINAARDGFAAVPERLEKAALNLGASRLRVFFTIALPLALRSIISGLILMFGRGMSEFGAVVIITYHPMITPILIYERFGAFGLKYARPVAVLFIMICLVFFILLRLISREKDGDT